MTEATKRPWRVGTKVGRTIYRNEELVGVMDTRELATEIVAAFNAHDTLLEQRDKLLEACKATARLLRDVYQEEAPAYAQLKAVIALVEGGGE